MKKTLNILFYLFTCLLFWSCNNDFVEENKKVFFETFNEPYVFYNSENQHLNLKVSVPEAKNSNYKIWQYPKWMKFQTMDGKFNDGNVDLEFNLNLENDHLGFSQSGTVILDIDNLGCIQLRVQYSNIGNPTISIPTKNLDFGTNTTDNFFEIRNSGDGNLRWKITNWPTWISPPNYGNLEGSISSHGSQQIYLKCNRGDLTPGKYTGEITIESNSRGTTQVNGVTTSKVSVQMEIMALENPGNVWSIDGKVTAAKFDKRSDLLYITTNSPSELIVFDMKQTDPSKITVVRKPISGAPGCLALSEDGSKLFIGCNGKLLQYETSTITHVKSIDLDFLPFDVIYGENDWCYLSPDVDYSSDGIYCVNIKTNEIKIPKFKPGFGHLYPRTYFTKTPGISKLLATRTSVSPSGVFLIDIAEPVPNENTVIQYWHEGYSNGRPLWLSADGDLLYTSNGSILRNPAKKSIDGDLLPIGYLPYKNTYSYAGWIDHCDNNHSIWASSTPDYYSDWNDYNALKINDTDLSTKSTLKSSDYVTTINGVKAFYPTSIHYIFSNKTGSMLFMVKNVNNWSLHVPNREYVNAWSLEYLEMK